MAVRFSRRTGWDLRESEFAAVVREARMDTNASPGLVDLTVSNPTVCGFSYPEVLGDLGAAGALVYDADPRGMRSAREAVAGYYADHGAAVDPDAVVLTTSTSEAYGYLFKLLCDPGDEVLVAQPSYPLFDFLADLDDVTLRSYPLFYDYGWWIDFAELERRIGPRTRAILVVHPNNPTGHWTSKAERERLAEMCARHGLALIVDEVFLDYPLKKSEEAVSFSVGEHMALTFILSGMSKIAGLPQMKVAWILTQGPGQHEALQRLETIADTFLSMNAPAQYALPGWLVTRHEVQGQILDRAKANLAAAKSSGLRGFRMDAGWNAVLGVATSVEELVRKLRVVVHPGSFYGMSERHRIVVSLLTREVEFTEGIRRLEGLSER